MRVLYRHFESEGHRAVGRRWGYLSIKVGRASGLRVMGESHTLRDEVKWRAPPTWGVLPRLDLSLHSLTPFLSHSRLEKGRETGWEGDTTCPAACPLRLTPPFGGDLLSSLW